VEENQVACGKYDGLMEQRVIKGAKVPVFLGRDASWYCIERRMAILRMHGIFCPPRMRDLVQVISPHTMTSTNNDSSPSP